MFFNNLLQILCFVVAVRFGYLYAQSCGDSMAFIPNGTYDVNRRLVLSTLSSNVSSQNGIYNVSTGKGADRIYALGMCIPRAEPKTCANCIKLASNALLKSCPNQTDSFYWKADKTLCYVRYSNHSFFDKNDLEPTQRESSSLDVTGNVTEYRKTWEDLMTRMISSTSNLTITVKFISARKYYTADVTPLLGFRTIYAMMTCIPGLSSGECYDCLQANVRTYQGCCSGKQGGTIMRPVCFFRFDTYPYLDAFDDISSPPKSSQDPPRGSQPVAPPPPPPPQHVATPPHHPRYGRKVSTGVIVVIVVSSVVFVVILALGLVALKRRQSYRTIMCETDDDITSPQWLQFDFKTIEAITNNFSQNNKVGQGGFGDVYKGILPNGTEVAVKRLSKNSGQGVQEFKNEVVIVAKLQHKSLVRLLGFCLEGDEQILIYEFVPNKSLDYFLFDPTKRRELDWRSRYNIIGGIARGILYLHQDSRLTIIHRDLKASNILLDNDMNPKIADFGMARIFMMDQTQAKTRKIAGTFGYMAPEYVMHGRFSMKSDIYSFGILLLEIISGKMNSSFNQIDESASNLAIHAWRLWRKGSALELFDPTLRENYHSDEVIRCIHIALLCVQEDPEDRPMMSTIILMLTSSTITLQVPRAPAFFFQRNRIKDSGAVGSNSYEEPIPCSINDESITELEPR